MEQLINLLIDQLGGRKLPTNPLIDLLGGKQIDENEGVNSFLKYIIKLC